MLQRPDVGVRPMHGKEKEGKDTRHLPLFLPYCLEAGSLSEFEVHLLARLTTLPTHHCWVTCPHGFCIDMGT